MPAGQWPLVEHAIRTRCQPDGRDVVEQRIDPHVDDVLIRPGNPDTQAKLVRLIGTSCRPSRNDRAPHWSSIRANDSGLFCEHLPQSIFVRTEFEVVVLLAGSLKGFAGDWRDVLDFLGLGLRVVLLLTGVVPALEGAEIDVTGIHQTFDECLNLLFVPWIRCPDEFVVRQIEHTLDAPKLGGVLIRSAWGLTHELRRTAPPSAHARWSGRRHRVRTIMETR